MAEWVEWAQGGGRGVGTKARQHGDAQANSSNAAPAAAKRRGGRPAVSSDSDGDLFDRAGSAAQVQPSDTAGAAPSISFDLLVIGRGGGSLEDLWAFNEEVLVRAVANCRIPIVSAVGHEIDFTLCDFAADVRAETPSAAAELISSSYLDHTSRLERAAERLGELTDDGFARAAERLAAARNHLRLLAPAALVEQAWLRLDDLCNRMDSAAVRAVGRGREELSELRCRWVAVTPETRVRFESQRLLGLWKRLQAASPRSVLKRGFAIVRDSQGQPVARRAEIAEGQALSLEFADGSAKIHAEG
jgi:exodeoxyribonuclease VII large subunit